MNKSFTTFLSVAFFMITVCSGCSHTYVDENGVKHIIGLVHLKLKQSSDDDSYAGEVVEVSNIGIAIHNNSNGSNYSIGYNREFSGYLYDHSLILGNPYDNPLTDGDEE